MKIKTKKNPKTCAELSVYLGYPVKEWIKNPDNTMEFDLAIDFLTPGELVVLKQKIKQLPLHREFEVS